MKFSAAASGMDPPPERSPERIHYSPCVIDGGRQEAEDAPPDDSRRGLPLPWGGAWGLLAIAVLALAARLLHLEAIQALFTFSEPIVDALSYHTWAQRIASGDWWGDRVFYQAPAYPYFLASVYASTGGGLRAAYAAQAALGAGGCVLLAMATAVFLGRAAGTAAGGLLALYPPAIFFDAIVQKASLASFLLCLLLFVLGLFQHRPGAGRALGAGAVLALLALTRENALILAAAIGPWLLLGFRFHPARMRARWAAAFTLGLLLPLLAVAGRNLAVGGTFAPTTSQLGPNFYIGNNPGAQGIYAPLVPGRETPEYEGADAARLAEEALGRQLSAGEVSRYWLERSFDFIRTQPGAWAALLLRKAVLTFHRFEVPDAEDLYLHAEHSRLLRWLSVPLHFGTLLGLAAAGAVFARRRRAPAGLLAALAGVFAASVVLTYVFARYRYPLVPLLVPFAGLGVAGTLAQLRRGEISALVVPAAAGAVVYLATGLPIVNEAPMRATSFYNLGAVLLERGRTDEAEQFLRRAEALFPDSAQLQLQLALLRWERGRLGEAEQHLRHAVSLAPRDAQVHAFLARVLEERGQTDAARRHRAKARQLSGADPATAPRGSKR